MFGRVEMNHPGGCVIGQRPIDMFLNGFEKMGAEIKYSDEGFELKLKNKLTTCTKLYFEI